MNEQSMRFRVGVFVLAAIILFAVLVTMSSGFPRLLGKGYDTYTIVFDDASGVAVGTPVRRSGIRIGNVKKVELDKDGSVRVTIGIDAGYPLYNTDEPRLTHGVLGGDTTIDFVSPPPAQEAPPPAAVPPAGQTTPSPAARERPPAPRPAAPPTGREAAPPVMPIAPPPPEPPGAPKGGGEEAQQADARQRTPAPPGTEFRGVQPADVNTLFRQLSDLVGPTQETLRDLRRTMRDVDRLTPLTEQAIREYTELGKATREMIPELRQTNEAIGGTARNWSRLGERLDILLQTNQDKLVKTIDSLNDTLTRLGAVLSDENQRNLTATLRNVRAGSENLDSISKNTDAMIKETRETVRRVNNSIGKADETLSNLQQATKPLAARSDSIVKNLDESTAKLNRALSQVEGLLQLVNQGDGTLRRILTDPSLYNHIDEAACAIDRIMPRLDRAMADFEVFADKLARHPESLGIGGAIRPSSGLKDAPVSTPPWQRPAGH